jgi:hypothetical protein
MVIRTFASSPAATADPHARVQEGISLVSRLKFDIQAKFVRVGINSVSLHGIFQLLQDCLLAGSPATLIHSNERGWIVVGLQKISSRDLGGKIFDCELRILASRLGSVSIARAHKRDTYDNASLPPSSSPLASDEADPVAMAERALTYRDCWIQLDAHAEVQLQCWLW